MKLRLACLLLALSSLAYGQGVLVPPQTALKAVNGVTMPIAGATITVCAASTSGYPCAPALVGAIFKDSGLTQPLSNPFTADSSGNYQFAIAAGQYTVTVTASGFSGYSYQISVGTSGGGTITGATTNQGLQQSGTTLGLLTCSSGQVEVSNGSSWACGSAAASPGVGLDNCAPDQTGNSFYGLASLTNFFYSSWQFVFNTSTYITCTVFVPQAATGATIVLDIAANDATAGHTANFQTCDQVINTGTINIGALTCAANQTFTTTATAYNRATLTFNVQSTLSNNSILVVKIATSTSGTAPTANMLVYPHFIL